jgi:recombination protein U
MNFPAGVRKKQINNIIKTENTKKVWKANMANKGMSLEEMVNNSNIYYLDNNIAVIHKKPIPIQIVKVSYPSRQKAVITEAYYRTPSTTDYNGIYKGRYIDFEAKENHNKTAFPLKNIHPHQITHLENIIKHGGIGFLIVSWNLYNEYYLLPFDVCKEYWDNSYKDGRQSIPYEAFKKRAYLIKEGFIPRLKYLDVVDELYFK